MPCTSSASAIAALRRASPLAALDGVPVLHWHGDQFEIPQGAAHLAGTAVCAHQAFSVGKAVLGLQFHLKADPATLERWLVGHACELSEARVDPGLLRAQAREHGDRLREAARDVMSRWLVGSLARWLGDMRPGTHESGLVAHPFGLRSITHPVSPRSIGSSSSIIRALALLPWTSISSSHA